MCREEGSRREEEEKESVVVVVGYCNKRNSKMKKVLLSPFPVSLSQVHSFCSEVLRVLIYFLFFTFLIK